METKTSLIVLTERVVTMTCLGSVFQAPDRAFGVVGPSCTSRIFLSSCAVPHLYKVLGAIGNDVHLVC